MNHVRKSISLHLKSSHLLFEGDEFTDSGARNTPSASPHITSLYYKNDIIVTIDVCC